MLVACPIVPVRRRAGGASRSKEAATVEGSRKRMVASAASLIGARGTSATSFSDALAHSHAPRGSIYYHFPDGKRQLVAEAVRWTTDQVLAYQRSCTAVEPAGVVEHFVNLFRRSLEASECRAGCPVAGVAIAAYADDEETRDLVRASFRSWTELLAHQLTRTGIPPRSARALSVTTVAAVEGALILSRAEGNQAPLEEVAGDLHTLARAAGPRP